MWGDGLANVMLVIILQYICHINISILNLQNIMHQFYLNRAGEKEEHSLLGRKKKNGQDGKGYYSAGVDKKGLWILRASELFRNTYSSSTA